MTTTAGMALDLDATDFHAEASEDDIGLWQIARRAEQRTSCPADAQEVALVLVRMLLDRGLQAGNLTKNGGFEAWTSQEPDEVIDRIRREWAWLGRTPTIDDIVWFHRP